ncbi:alpha-tubulin suppressor-like RCC1 family protein [Aneurinibacillus soli]|uniref:Cellulosome-anchoring protein n=1 Tax=Aneurinibacillus soli TaxID=1500254 RepID=A0A0U4WGF4_9BACL|nr:immunoglobulin-like domain-containing protein [Aneurinibacillus soli]PYE61402.1 alpha-tubulin suppressor-like RCC1 family protein [Aneurinibacillus soli]BAU27769.1 Cellulosome-anchoring protein precursor [Aneurinibacillus soli]
MKKKTLFQHAAVCLLFTIMLFGGLLPVTYASTLTVSSAKGKISGGSGHSLALKPDETVVAWGDNSFGQLNIPGLTGVRSIAAGYNHSLALKSDGKVVAWGFNNLGQLNIPAGLTGVVDITAGGYHSLALKSDGTVAAWGYNSSGQCTVPTGLTGVVAISGGDSHSLALKSDGTVVAWGDNSSGQCTVPAGLTGVVAIAAGGYHSLALKSDGTVVAWGYNSSGQCSIPTGLTGVVAIAAGSQHSLALKSDGTVVVWGDNSSGQCNIPAGLTSGVVGIDAGQLHSLAVKSDGTVVSWGYNSKGQATVPVGLNLLPPNIAPVSYDATLATSQNTPKSNTLSATDADGDALTYSIVSQGNKGTVSITNSSTGAYTYTPNANATGMDTFTFKTNDGTVDSNISTVTVNILSNNADLSSLTLSQGTLSPAFASGTTTYTASVGNKISSIDVTSTLADSAATIVVNGTPVTSGSAKTVPLNVGSNTITILVTAQDGSTKTYTVTVTRAAQTDAEAVAETKEALNVGYTGGDSASGVTQNVTLVTTGANGTTISWSSDTPDVLATDGTVTRPAYLTGDRTITLTATITKGGATDIKTFTVTVKALSQTDVEAVTEAKAALDVGYTVGESAGSVTQNVTLPMTGLNNTAVSWSSDKPGVIAANGTVTRPEFTSGDSIVILTATVTKNSATDTKSFSQTVKAKGYVMTDADAVAGAKTALDIGYAQGDSASGVTQNVILPSTGVNGTVISWSSSNPAILASDGTVQRPEYSTGDATVTVTATITKNGVTDTKTFGVKVIKRAPQQNADISSLVSSQGSVTLSANTYNYAVNVGNSVSSMTITPTLADSLATVTVNNALVTSGQPSQAIALQVGQNLVTITVTAQDGVTVKTYKITVTRAPSSSSGGGGGSSSSSASSNIRTMSLLNSKGIPEANVEIIRTTTADGKTSDSVTLTATKAVEAVTKADENNKTVIIPMNDAKGKEADQVALTVQKEALSVLTSRDASIQVMAEKASIELPKETVASLNKQDIQMMIEPVTKESDVKQTRTLLHAQAEDGTIVGTPLHIETNFSGRTKITLPFTGMNLPADPKEQEAFLRSLNVFIEHSDGEKKVDKGEIQYDKNNKPVGISIWVDKFSTFTMVEVPESKKETKLGPAALTDIQGHWAEQGIQKLVQAGSISGYPDGTFKPDQTITRAEFVSIVVKAFGLQPKDHTKADFQDTKTHWAKTAIDTAYANNIINGYNATTFGADDTITREQMAVILTNSKKSKAAEKHVNFIDDLSISTWAQEAVKQAVAQDIIKGYPNHTFKPKQAATRAEAVTMIINALHVK